MSDSFAIIDACSLINLYASNYFESILKCQSKQFFIVEQVKNESLYIRKTSELIKDDKKEPIELNKYLRSGLIKVVKLKSQNEKNLFINLVSQIDDGEAATFAVAIERKMEIITDDRKAIRLLKREAPTVVCFSTLDIIKSWTKSASIRPTEIKSVLNNILLRARYRPHKNHHLLYWWQEILGC